MGQTEGSYISRGACLAHRSFKRVSLFHPLVPASFEECNERGIVVPGGSGGRVILVVVGRVGEC